MSNVLDTDFTSLTILIDLPPILRSPPKIKKATLYGKNNYFNPKYHGIKMISKAKTLFFCYKTILIQYLLALDPYSHPAQTNQMERRLQPTRVFNDTYKLQRSSHSFNIDAARLWNLAPTEIRSAPTLATAKTAIRKYTKSLPIQEAQSLSHCHIKPDDPDFKDLKISTS